MRRLVPITAVLALVALSCGGSAEDASTTFAPGAQGGVTTEAGVVGGTEVAAVMGGTVSSDDGHLILDIPAGALAEDVAIAVTSLDPADWPEEFVDGAVIGDVYDLQPSGLTFSEPVTISHRLTGAGSELDSGSEVPLTLLVVVSDDGTWEAPADQVISRDGEDLLHTGVIDHFSVTVLFDGAVSVKFTPTRIERRVGETFEAILEASFKWETSSTERISPVTIGSVKAVSVPEFFPLLSKEGEGLKVSPTYQCSSVGQGVYGVRLSVFPVPHDVLRSDGTFKTFPVLVALMVGTAGCTEKPSSPSAGDTITIPADFIPTDDSPAECGDTFTDTLVVVFEDGTTGTLAFEGEPESRPFTLTDYLVVSAYEIDLGFGDGSFAYERFELDLSTGEGTATFGVSPPEAGLTCGYTLDFGEHVSDQGLIEFDF